MGSNTHLLMSNLRPYLAHKDNKTELYGKLLLEYAVDNLHITKLDVNEQNQQAIGFYEKFGFKVVEHSEKDSMGKDYPILHMSL